MNDRLMENISDERIENGFILASRPVVRDLRRSLRVRLECSPTYRLTLIGIASGLNTDGERKRRIWNRPDC